MRAFELRGPDLGQLVMTERADPRPGSGEVLVRMRAASLNYRDLLIARGKYGRGGLKFPLVPVSDGAGEVIGVGPDAGDLKPGDRVMGNFFRSWVDGPPSPEKQAEALGGNVDGVLAEQVVLRADASVPVPDELSFEEAATLPCAAVTAWVGLVKLGKIQAGETVLAQGTGGVSIFALQLAKALGARVILTSSSDAKLDRGKQLGADQTINYGQTPDWDSQARALTGGRGVDHILEVVGVKTLPQSLRAVRDGGHLTLVGLLGGERATVDLAKNDRGVRVDSVYVGSAANLRDLAQTVARAGIRPVIDRIFPFAEARDAYQHLAGGAHLGKVAISI